MKSEQPNLWIVRSGHWLARADNEFSALEKVQEALRFEPVVILEALRQQQDERLRILDAKVYYGKSYEPVLSDPARYTYSDGSPMFKPPVAGAHRPQAIDGGSHSPAVKPPPHQMKPGDEQSLRSPVVPPQAPQDSSELAPGRPSGLGESRGCAPTAPSHSVNEPEVVPPVGLEDPSEILTICPRCGDRRAADEFNCCS